MAVRSRFLNATREELLQHHILKAYRDYYKKFNKTYHVQLQLESILHKGKVLPNVNPLVDSAFAAEIDTLILTATHDLDKLTPPISFDATETGEAFTQMNGNGRPLKANDMVMRDANGPVCTIIYGQDNVSPVSEETTNALYVAYAPDGVSADEVSNHLEMIRRNVLMVQEDAEIAPPQVISAEAS